MARIHDLGLELKCRRCKRVLLVRVSDVIEVAGSGWQPVEVISSAATRAGW